MERLDPSPAKRMPGFMLKTPDAAVPAPSPEAVRHEIPAMGNVSEKMDNLAEGGRFIRSGDKPSRYIRWRGAPFKGR